jgi:TDG/mug DNA glycosylase family protein
MAARRKPAVLTGFAPIGDSRATLLILGSMPGAASLAAHQYYAHPRNAFWPMLEAVWGIPAALDYATRVRAVVAARIAIWDVLASCQRASSLDADIEHGSIVVNDFEGFFRRHPQISMIAFNGSTAQLLYRRHVMPSLPTELRQIPALRMPSTSPAHAALSLQRKVQRWRELRRAVPAAST